VCVPCECHGHLGVVGDLARVDMKRTAAEQWQVPAAGILRIGVDTLTH
jgi:hypothetical protein